MRPRCKSQIISLPPPPSLFVCFSHRRKLPLKEENGKESHKPDTIEIKVHGDHSIHTKLDGGKA